MKIKKFNKYLNTDKEYDQNILLNEIYEMTDYDNFQSTEDMQNALEEIHNKIAEYLNLPSKW
ncbi:hypothetical protein M0Q97_08000 [Candidatus Dojkabacteria bacterium]|nr:hypothetical protein [Candidatus Dojkabacteria bacterium]